MDGPPLHNGLYYDHGGAAALLVLHELSRNPTANAIEWFSASAKATTTLTEMCVNFRNYNATPENNRRIIAPFCRCIANLRHRNPNHPLRSFTLSCAKNEHRAVVDQLLVAAKEYGIRCLVLEGNFLTIQSLVKFCRGNTHLKALHLGPARIEDDASTATPQPQDSSAILALDELQMSYAFFENSAAATQFLNWIAHVTYPALELGDIAVEHDIHDESDVEDADYEEKKNARLRIVSALLKPSVEQLTLVRGCPIETIDAIAACATVTQIQLDNADLMPIAFRHAEVRHLLQTIAARNRELARFVANPQDYPRDDLLPLMRQFDRCPTGRYMLACSVASVLKKKPKDDSTEATKLDQAMEQVLQVTGKLDQAMEQVSQVTGKLDQAMELLKALAQQKQDESATLLTSGQNSNEARSAVGSLLHDDARNNGAAPESATLPQTNMTGNATADETFQTNSRKKQRRSE